MEAFISYSHQDEAMLQRLHTHLAQLKRTGILKTWTDEQISAGGRLDEHISTALENARLFIALVSPDYIASNYCYDKEFQRAEALHKEGKLIIVPVILSPCDWLSTPLKEYKALPKDGKPISEWASKDNAFLDIVKGLRALLENSGLHNNLRSSPVITQATPTRNYRPKKDFDSIQKLEFLEASFEEIRKLMHSYMEELASADEQFRYHLVKDTAEEFEGIIVNRHKMQNAEATLRFGINGKHNGNQGNVGHIVLGLSEYALAYTLVQGSRQHQNYDKGFGLDHDEYQLFWKQIDIYNRGQEKSFTAREIAEIIWREWLEKVGIEF